MPIDNYMECIGASTVELSVIVKRKCAMCPRNFQTVAMVFVREKKTYMDFHYAARTRGIAFIHYVFCQPYWDISIAYCHRETIHLHSDLPLSMAIEARCFFFQMKSLLLL